MKEFRVWQVDAFSAERYKGNPAAIVFDADPLTTEEMQTIARQMNLSETVFLCKPTARADYRVRIFTPGMEIPFAGHPTIAAAFAHTATRTGNGSGAETVLHQECGAGTIPVAVTHDEENGGALFTIVARAEPTVATDLTRDDIAAMLRLAPQVIGEEPAEVCSIGLPWLIARVEGLAALESARPEQDLIESICRERQAVGLTVYCTEAALEDCSVHVRTFAPGAGVAEDPVCGSGNGAIAVHLARHLRRDSGSFSYRAEQGLEVCRRGVLHLSVDRDAEDESLTVRLGGRAVKVLDGHLWI